MPEPPLPHRPLSKPPGTGWAAELLYWEHGRERFVVSTGWQLLKEMRNTSGGKCWCELRAIAADGKWFKVVIGSNMGRVTPPP